MIEGETYDGSNEHLVSLVTKGEPAAITSKLCLPLSSLWFMSLVTCTYCYSRTAMSVEVYATPYRHERIAIQIHEGRRTERQAMITIQQ